jgi:hypothetical protein
MRQNFGQKFAKKKKKKYHRPEHVKSLPKKADFRPPIHLSLYQALAVISHPWLVAELDEGVLEFPEIIIQHEIRIFY